MQTVTEPGTMYSDRHVRAKSRSTEYGFRQGFSGTDVESARERCQSYESIRRLWLDRFSTDEDEGSSPADLRRYPSAGTRETSESR